VLVNEMSAMITTRCGLDDIFIGGVAVMATYIRLAVLPRQLHTLPVLKASSIFGRSKGMVACRAMWPKQV
jgi:hypothetical protein